MNRNTKAISMVITCVVLAAVAVTCVFVFAPSENQSASAAATAGGSASPTSTYAVVDTGQTACYDDKSAIVCPTRGKAFFGQDSQHSGSAARYARSPDGLTVRDETTGLTWQASPDTTGDSPLTASDKLTWPQAQARAATLNAASYGGYTDWRLPTIKELYSLIDFRGTDPSPTGLGTSGLVPFIDTSVFQFAYGQLSAGERVIDAQYASSTLYVAGGADGPDLLFGVNFADGRIKGYGLVMPGGREKTFFVQCVRGNTSYGENLLQASGEGTIIDTATGLEWAQTDSGSGMNWQDALAWVEARNAADYLGHDDWRLPNVKELQSIVDYTRSPDTTASAAIDPIFACSSITNEAGQLDYPYYWTGTTHASADGSGSAASYIAFGRALGYMDGTWQDVHGAGAQRSDPKLGSASTYPRGNGPQGDAIRILNYVRLVRDVSGR
jgi:hypothetical protein